MRRIKVLLKVVVLLLVGFIAIAYLLPRTVTVSRSITINAAPGAIFPYVNSMAEMQKWSPWADLDPDMKTVLSGPETGVGNRFEWASDDPDVGAGSEIITQSIQDQQVVTKLNFGDMGTAEAAMMLEPSGAATHVTWDLVADMGMTPIGRWMGLFMDHMVGKQYETGLANLKSLIETD